MTLRACIRLAVGLLLPFALAIPIGGACSSFGEEELPEAGVGDGGVGSDTGLDAPGDVVGEGGGCGRCEAACLPVGCAPYEPAEGLPADLPVTGLAVSGNFVFVSAAVSGGTLFRIPIPGKSKTSPAVPMLTSTPIDDIALAANDVILASYLSPSGPIVLSGIDKTTNGGAVRSTSRPSARVAANDTHAYGAVSEQLHVCSLASFPNTCISSPAAALTVSQLAAVGDSYCIAGSAGGANTGIFCGAGETLSPVLRVAEPKVNALTMRGGKVYWATDLSIGSTSYSSTVTVTKLPVPGAKALAVEGNDLFYIQGTTIVRCPKDDCPDDKRDILTSVPGIERLAVSDEHVYFTHGAPGGRRLARVPRRP